MIRLAINKVIVCAEGEVAEQDFLSLMTVVTERVGNISQPQRGKSTRRTQLPSVASTLRKKIYFPNLTDAKVKASVNDESSSEDEEKS